MFRDSHATADHRRAVCWQARCWPCQFRQALVVVTSMNRHVDLEARAKPMGSRGGKLCDDLCDAQGSHFIDCRELSNTGQASLVWRKMSCCATDWSTMPSILFEIQALLSLRGTGAWVDERPHGLTTAFSLVLSSYCFLHFTYSLNIFVPSPFFNCVLQNTSSIWLSGPVITVLFRSLVVYIIMLDS